MLPSVGGQEPDFGGSFAPSDKEATRVLTFPLGEANQQTQMACVLPLMQCLKIFPSCVAAEFSSDRVLASLPYCDSLE